MGKQIQFHALSDDCQALFSFIRTTDEVMVVPQDGPEAEVTTVASPCVEESVLIVWQRSLRTELRRGLVSRPVQPYYRVRTGVGLEFSRSLLTDWNGHKGLVQGRVYASTDQPNKPLMQWYDRVARWIRGHWARCPVDLSGYVGPNAMQWHSDGGLLLPMFRPPVTAEWERFFSQQLAARAPDA